MKRRTHYSNGLEAAPDVMALLLGVLGTMAVIAFAFARDYQLPAVQLPQATASQLGEEASAEVAVTLRIGSDVPLEVFVENRRIEDGLEGLEEALRASGAGVVALRADAGIAWEDSVTAMDTALTLGMQLAVSVAR